MHGFVTVLIPFRSERADAVNAVLGKLGNPACAGVRERLDAMESVHFMSITVACEPDDAQAHLVLEASVDGDPRAALAELASRLDGWLRPILEASGEPAGEDLGAHLERYRRDLGVGWRQTLGLAFSGTPEMSVKRIKSEEITAKAIEEWLVKNDQPQRTPLEKIECLRDALFADPEKKWFFVAGRLPAEAPEPIGFWPLLASAMRVFWPLVLVPLACILITAWWAADWASGARSFPYVGWGVAWAGLGALLSAWAFRESIGALRSAIWGLLLGAFVGVVLTALSRTLMPIALGGLAGVLVGVFSGWIVLRSPLGGLASAIAGLLAGAAIASVVGAVDGALPGGLIGGAAAVVICSAVARLLGMARLTSIVLVAMPASAVGFLGGAVVGAAHAAWTQSLAWTAGLSASCLASATVWLLCDGKTAWREWRKSVLALVACAAYGAVLGSLTGSLAALARAHAFVGMGAAVIVCATGAAFVAWCFAGNRLRAISGAGFSGAAVGALLKGTVAAVALLVTYAFLLVGAVAGAWIAAVVLASELLATVLVLALCFVAIRVSEQIDAPHDHEPEARRLAEIMALENQGAQNHLAGVSEMKAGPVRGLALGLALWFIGEFGRYASPPGYLSGIGTIHFARWVLIPGTNKLLFLSNYDGSWTSYLEDFIARAHRGLTAIWSNTRDFPRTRGLLEGGASDGERFKRWARCQQRPTRFWYSAYPLLTTARIRINARICHGLAAASTDEQAARWLQLMQYKAPGTVESKEIPTLVFGGLKPLNHSRCMVIRLSDDPASAAAWLDAIRPHIQYGEEKPSTAAWVVGFSQSGLAKLGLGDALPSFPAAFCQGMAQDVRSIALGDVGEDAPQNWLWGGPHNAADAVVFLYADSPEHLATQEQLCRAVPGGRVIYELLAHPLPRRDDLPIKEPFGFTDGISQPIMRGSRKWVTQRNPMHVVEPGEMVLGYPDNLGYVAPLPRHNGFDLGRNGTFLVVRQLEQDPDEFNAFLDEKVAELRNHAAVPRGDVSVREWIAAKMVGRWKDGSSLVRHPARPAIDSGAAKFPDNDFKFGAEDPDGLCCPFGAHIRRANPRESFDPGSEVQIGITNRHRIFRVGRSYRPQAHGATRLEKPGLIFMCVNADIEGQFEFLQQTWLLGSGFHGLRDEIDPAVGYGTRDKNEVFTIPTEKGPIRLGGLRDFVKVRGGAYLFMPSKRVVDYMCEHALRGRSSARFSRSGRNPASSCGQDSPPPPSPRAEAQDDTSGP
jgi:deferrochelatase/peroxidase EfeB